MINSSFLSGAYLLRGATIGDIDAIQIISTVVEFKAGETIVSDQDKSRDLMVLMEGRARVETRSGDLIDELRVGDVIGEISFLDGKNRTANVSAVGTCKLLVIPADGLRQLMKENPKLEATMLRNMSLALCERLREANQQVEALLVSR